MGDIGCEFPPHLFSLFFFRDIYNDYNSPCNLTFIAYRICNYLIHRVSFVQIGQGIFPRECLGDGFSERLTPVKLQNRTFHSGVSAASQHFSCTSVVCENFRVFINNYETFAHIFGYDVKFLSAPSQIFHLPFYSAVLLVNSVKQRSQLFIVFAYVRIIKVYIVYWLYNRSCYSV